MKAIVLVALLACRREAPPQPVPAVAAASDAAAAAPAGFGLYVLALSWAPSFCCGHPDKEECRGLDGSFAATHLTLHGLWPNYTDDEATANHAAYPEFCGTFRHCKEHHDRSCEPEVAAIPEDMRTLGPGYVGDHDFLADHEWPKHGSCTGLSPAVYFRAALGAMQAVHDDALRGSIGSDIALADLQGAFGVPAESVLLSCDAGCRLAQVSICLAHDADNRPTTPIRCPLDTTQARYDNGCVTRHCERVIVPAAGSCEVKREQWPRKQHACNHPGQGPACTRDDECVNAGFVRCAHSGCCTSQP